MRLFLGGISREAPALTRSTQKPFSALWNVTRSTSPARASVGAVDLGDTGLAVIMEMNESGRYSMRPTARFRPPSAVAFWVLLDPRTFEISLLFHTWLAPWPLPSG